MDAEQAAHVLQRLQQLEQAVTEQVVARRQAEQALAEAQGRITQLSQTAQQGTRATGQVIDTRVLGSRSFVAKAYAGAVGQQLSDDMTKAEISTTVLNIGSISQEAQARSVHVHWTSIGSHRRCATRLGEAWRLLVQGCSRRTTRGWS